MNPVPQTIADDPSPPIAREGWPIVAGFVVVSVTLSAAAALMLPLAVFVVVAVATGLLSLWCIWFFRDPARRIPASPGAVISPADGVVCFVGLARPPEDLGLPSEEAAALTRISIFMNVFNVHVNRSPVAGRVEKIAYRPGKFFNASLDKASEHNERCALLLRMSNGGRIACVQIAGLVARRIVCRVKEGAELRPGQRFGLIRFGSRVDVYVPTSVTPGVKVGDRSVAGETVLAVLGGVPGLIPTTRVSEGRAGAVAMGA